MQTLQYISVMVPPASSGTYNLELETFDLQANVTLTLAVSGVVPTTSFNFANQIATQFTTYLAQNGMLFDNVPPNQPLQSTTPFLSFPDQPYNAMFNVTWTEHVVCIMSQCNFEVRVASNSTGANTQIDWQPILVDLETAEALAVNLGSSWDDSCGDELTDAQKINVLKYASSEMVSALNNNIVLTTYLYYEITNGSDSINLYKTPVRDFFPPVIRPPDLFATPQAVYYASVKSNFALDRNRGILTYRFAQNFLFNYEPYDIYNEIMVAYIGGYQRIPSVIKEYTVKLSNLIAISDEYSEMAGESSRFKFRNINEIINSWGNMLKGYSCP